MSDRLPASSNTVGWHRAVLLVSGLVVVLALVLEVRSDQRVAVRGFPGYPVPETCVSRTWLGVKCPGCGLSRSIIHLARGAWRDSWHDHRLGGLVALAIVFQVPYRLLTLWRPERPLIASRWRNVLFSALLALLLGNWLIDLVGLSPLIAGSPGP